MKKEKAKEYMAELIELSEDYFELYSGTGLKEKTERMLLELVDTIPEQSKKTYTILAIFATNNIANGINVGEKIKNI